MTTKTYQTPNDIAEELGVSPDKVLAWIASGQLKAIDVGSKPNARRRRYIISQQSKEEFLQSRIAKPKEAALRPERAANSGTKQYV